MSKKTEYEKELEEEIEKLENTIDSRIGKHKNLIELKITNKKAKLEAYKKGKQDKEKEIMNNGHFVTSMNRKVCYNAGYEKGKQEERERMKKLKEGVDEVFEFYDIKLLLTNIKYKEGNKIK